jgi:branched-chain amino acid transport system substrate-binding protein
LNIAPNRPISARDHAITGCGLLPYIPREESYESHQTCDQHCALAVGFGSAQAQISDNVVKIGVLNDQSGLYADGTGPGSVTAARMAVEDFGGKVLGKPIEVVFADHQNKPDIGSAIANQWIDTEKVDVIVDVPTSSIALAVQEITKNKNRVHLNSGAGTSDLTGKACSPTGIHWPMIPMRLPTAPAQAS